LASEAGPAGAGGAHAERKFMAKAKLPPIVIARKINSRRSIRPSL
jgi:hypothetical protein